MVPTEAATGWQHAMLEFARANVHLIEAISFALGFAESIVFLSLLVPSTFIFLALSGIHGAAGGEFWGVWLAAAAGACLGDHITYAMGRRYRADAARTWPISKYPGLIPRGEALFDRWGVMSIIIGKFIGMLRPFVPLVAGTSAMSLAAFAPASAISCLLWAAVVIAPGYGIVLLTF
jgi:membrane protein DedA with SNARE-associated domain